MRISLFLKCALILAAANASGATWYVGTGVSAQDADGFGYSAERPFYSLEYAFGKASDNDAIYLAPGVYNPQSEIIVDKAVRIVGAPGVFINGASLSSSVRFMIVDNPNAVVESICFSNKSYTVSNTTAHRYGTAVLVKQGTLRDSIVAKCSYNGYLNHGVLANIGGTVEDCEVTDAKSGGLYQNRSTGFCQTAGTTTGLKVNNCTTMATFGCAVAISGGVVDGALIEGNGVTWTQAPGVLGAGVWMDGGELKNSVIRNNTNQGAVAGVYVQGTGKVTDCEIYGNRVYDLENAQYRASALHVGSSKASVTGTVITNNLFAFQPYAEYLVNSGAVFENNTVDTFRQTATVAYVSPGGSGEYPYDTPEKATSNINDALNALSRDPEVLVDLYVGEGTFYIENPLILNKGVRVHGAGRDKTVIAGRGSSGPNTRAFYIENDAALVEDLTVRDTYYNYYRTEGSGAGAVLKKGTVRNVSFRSCTIKNAYQFATVYMTGGLLADSEITDASDGWSYSANGEGLYIGGGLATNCVIHGNTRGQYAANGGHGVYVDGGTLDSCIVTNNGVRTDCSVAGAGLRLKKGIVRNSLIAGNFSKTGTAGAYIDSGIFEYNTVYGNVTAVDTTGQSGVTVGGASAIVRNCIIYGNGAEGSAAGSIRYISGTMQTNILDKTVAGIGNIMANPSLDDAFRPQLGSPAIDAAAPVAEVGHDLAGAVRPNGDASDIGCYEFDWSAVGFTAKISISQNSYPADGATAAIANAVVVGADDDIAYAWYVDGAAEPVSDAPQFSSASLTPGRHSLKLVVTCGGNLSEDIVEEAFIIRPLEAFAGPGGSDEFPYDTPAKAARVLNDAVNALWNGPGASTKVRVAEGVVSVRDTVNIQSAVQIIGEGPAKSILDGRFAGYRGFMLGHEGALLEGLCISNFSYSAQTERGCGAGVNISLGTVRDCRVTRCRTDGAYQGGSGIFISGGLVTGTEIDNCYHRWTYDSYGNGLYQTGGVVSNSWIHNNPTFCQRGAAGASVYGGLLTHSLIEANGHGASTPIGDASVHSGGGLGVFGTGVVRNCIVRDNLNVARAAGVRMEGGRIEHCTVVNNTAVSTSSGNSGLEQSGGTIVNSIFYGNGSAYASLGSVTITGGLFVTNLIDVANGAAVDCLVADPGFADASAGDFHLALGSAAIDRGTPLADEYYDFDGAMRDSAPDLGAFEYVSAGGPLSAGILIEQSDYPLGAVLSATATVEGADADIVEYGWYIVDGPEATKIGSAANVAWTNAPAGIHALRLYVRNRGGEEVTVFNDRAFNVRPFSTYASLTGANLYPYDTPEKASTNVADAFSALWNGPTQEPVSLHIAAGEYMLTDTFTLDRPVSVVGEGMDRVFLNGSDLGKRGAILADSGAYLEGVTISGIRHAAGNGVGIYMSKGTIRGVRITACRPTAHGINGVGLYMEGGLAEGCEISGNNGGNYMYGATALGAYVSGGVFRNGKISGNVYTGEFANFDTVGLTITGGLVENVEISSNALARVTGAATFNAGCRISGGTLRNALIYHNSTTKKDDADGVALVVAGEAAQVVNCTIVENTGAGAAVKTTSGTIVNTIIADNPGGDLAAGPQTSVSYSRWGELTVPRNGNTADIPHFRNPVKLDWSLVTSSPLVNRGTLEPWGGKEAARAAKDIAGNARLSNGAVDMGCYENTAASTKLILR